MADTLATLKEQHQVSPVAQLSQILAPRYLTRSRASSEVIEDESRPIDSSEDRVSVDTDELKHESSADESAIPTTASDTSSALESPTKSDCVSSMETSYPTQKRKAITNATNASVTNQRKRGRHKEYTAPTGVWKTNGGYISTIYVGNRRIYGPLRDNPEEAGIDRQKLIEAKTFVKTEIEMRNFIATLKQQSGGSVRTPMAASVDPSSLFVVSGPVLHVSRRSTQKRPVLTTITSAATTIEPIDEPSPDMSIEDHQQHQ